PILVRHNLRLTNFLFVLSFFISVFDNKRTKEDLRRLKMKFEVGNQSLSVLFCNLFKDGPCPKCEAGWEHHGGKCYNFTTNKSSWEESRCFCQSQGGDLRRLKDVMNEAEDKFWIGLTDSEEEGRWLWVDGSPLKFWNYKEPDNWTGKDPNGEDCVRMGEKVGAPDLKCWFDKSCKVPHKSICEKPEKTDATKS
uniref:C-type lectin domain-containing protein n=1 Tax=Amphiprion ocellaris TaxID=80972 RepID=A0A3Q1C0L2_AMPOC